MRRRGAKSGGNVRSLRLKAGQHARSDNPRCTREKNSHCSMFRLGDSGSGRAKEV